MSVAKQPAAEWAALRELTAMTFRAELWFTLALSDTKLRYRRTTLGPLWVTLSTGLTVLMIGSIYGSIFNGAGAGLGKAGYMAFFATGLIFWSFVSAVITEGCAVFLVAGGLIKGLRIPLLFHVYRMLARNVILLAHNLLIVILLWAFIRWPIDWTLLQVIPGFVILVVTLLGITLTLSVLCTRFRDIQQTVAAVLQLLFLLTPIFWPPSSITTAPGGFLLKLNPFYYLIEIVRAPLLGEVVSGTTWVISLFIAVFSFHVGLALYGRFWHRIPFWL